MFVIKNKTNWTLWTHRKKKKKKNIVDAMITKLKNKLDAGTHGNQEALI